MKLKGKTAIITGANSGIGHECVLRFLAEGACVAGVDINTDRTDDLAAAAAQYGTQFEAYKCDVRDEQAVKAVVEAVIGRFNGRIDIMLNVAGITVDLPVTRTDKSVFERVMDVNAGGTFNFCKHTAVYMKKQRYGAIVNTSSESNLAVKIAIVREHHWIAVAMFGESAIHPITSHQRCGLGVMNI